MVRPIILELDETLAPQEKMIDIKTISINTGNGKNITGYVAVIKDFSKHNEIRYGNLKATRHTNEIHNSVM